MDDGGRLKKLCAAKDAQIEALYGRVEILTDDIAVLRGERAYLHEAAQSSKRECYTFEMRARRFEQDARAATLRADEAEQALIASECSFAKDLDALRTLLRTSDDAQQQAANTELETASLISQIETLRAELRALDEASPYTARLAAAEASAATAAAQEQASAARAAAADDFIDAMPEGYDTPVGERGSTLSGGQKQRIAIARALLLNPRLLILDDATSSVDLQTESRIQAALDHLMRGRTSFVIAQRISTVINADLILVLDRGKIVASGRHLDLLENNDLYAEICRSQLTGDPAQQPVEA